MMTRRSAKPSKRRAFTLIELLVVVAIISLLIAILLPSLNKARKYARTAACEANFHGIGQSMSIYAADWNDAIIGGPTTSGAFLDKDGADPFQVASNSSGTYSDTNCPNIVRMDDWMSPILAMNNNLITSAGDVASRTKRFMQTVTTKLFICSENVVPATEYSGDPTPLVPGTFLMPSYSTSAIFYWYPAGHSGQNLETRGSTPSGGTLSAPGGYTPKVGNVGQPGRKIFMGDTARFVNCTSPTAPDVNLTFNFSSSSTAFNSAGFSTGGACFKTDSGYCTDGAPNNGSPTGPYDPRALIFRHGGGSLHSPAGTYKGAFLFFDGHAETLNDLAAGDPSYWMPSGTVWNPTTSSTALQLQQTVKIKYYNNHPAALVNIN